MFMKIAIIEDEMQARKMSVIFLKTHFSNIDIVGEAEDIDTGVALIDREKPDIVLLDVQLADGNSFEILDRIEYKKSKIIFISSYSHFAIKAFKYGAIHYLLKPYTEIEFIEAINRVSLENINDSAANLNLTLEAIKEKKDFSKLSIPTITGFDIVSLSDIIYMESIPDQVAITCLNGKKLRVNKSLTEYSELLENNGFERVHKSFLVNFKHVENYLLNEIGGLLILSNGKEIPVSRRKKARILAIIK